MSRGRQPGNVVKVRPATDKRAKAWTSMRVLARFDVRQICVTAEIERKNAQDYITRLTASGYLRIVKPKSSAGRSLAIYQLVRNSGPKAPITRKTGHVYDPNTNHIHTPVEAKGERIGKEQRRT